MTRHLLKANCKTVHLGGFSPNLEPALTVDSGDRIDIETYSGYYVADKAPPEFLTPEFLDICQNLPTNRKIGPGPHLLTGPIYVNNAEPGNVLEIQIEEVYPSLSVGFNAIRAGWGVLPEYFPESKLRFISLDLEQRTAEFPVGSGAKIPLHPFFGIIGVANPEINRSSIPPERYGGNMDNQELQPGTRLFLPVSVRGGLLSVGDGHSAQGDGEVNGTAIETSMKGTVKIILRQDLFLIFPFAETPTHVVIMGFGRTLDDALEMAVKQTVYWLQTFAGLKEEDAYVLCSIAVNFRMTQAVNNPQKGVHGMVPKSILPEVKILDRLM
ncbi:acetamidase/formamidase family protein [Microcoleus sp. LEGE 07076]|uniref:acetamidase/formamidase family protein n=1 Tax=Microcoleus sp. LEGE 07076 TaxID=915322 RepID=UPI00187E000A|nr:acetamidase/formamidase family protein [Microcoleus sp. LEGE 07076]MBE9183153.1 acetamidase/formamidase family protein [Microcoleus sp. LEGE 07076]